MYVDAIRFFIVHTTSSISEWACNISLMPVNLIQAEFENSLFMAVDWKQLHIPEDQLIPDAFGNMQTIGKPVAMMIMKYVMQRLDNDPSLNPQEVLDGWVILQRLSPGGVSYSQITPSTALLWITQCNMSLCFYIWLNYR